MKTKNKHKYKVAISYTNSSEDEIRMELVDFITEDIDFSIEQYGRNRNPFKWEIIRKININKNKKND